VALGLLPALRRRREQAEEARRRFQADLPPADHDVDPLVRERKRVELLGARGVPEERAGLGDLGDVDQPRDIPGDARGCPRRC
jgi:hypothetical protein